MTGNVPEYSVSEVSGKIKKTVENAFDYVRVRGELGRVNRHGSGHVYLDLKDERAVLSGVIWRGVASRMSMAPEQGMEVIATGKVTTFAGQSKYQLQIERLEPAGAGALMALYEQRKKALAAEGLFDESRKKPLPTLPSCIGVVTSPTGAVIRDILHRLRDRFPSHVIVWPAAVQGENAPKSLIAGITGFNRGGNFQRPDVIIVARGGGSLEDLWCFNDEGVARAFAASEIPIISAVGHETDTTLIDFVADRRAPTPTAAAEMAVPVRLSLLEGLEASGMRLVGAVRRRTDGAALRLSAASAKLGEPDRLLAESWQRHDRLADRLRNALYERLSLARTTFSEVAGALQPGRLKERVLRNEERLAASTTRQQTAQRRLLERGKERLSRAVLRPRPLQHAVKTGQERAAMAASRMRTRLLDRLQQTSQKLTSRGRLLESYSHKNVLARGFTLVLDKDGNLVRHGAGLEEGQGVTVRFADQDRAAIIRGDTTRVAASAAPKKKKARPGSTAQSSLFDDVSRD